MVSCVNLNKPMTMVERHSQKVFNQNDQNPLKGYRTVLWQIFRFSVESCK